MRPLFPNNFDLRLFRGPRAEQFNSVPDAFQQLVGDGLKSAADHHAQISTTKGMDGSIDIFMEGDYRLTGPFDGLPLPLIIECKHHDDSLARVAENIIKEWGKLSKKLQKQAEANWPGLFAPWQKARAYAYCVSANIPAKQNRDELQSKIRNFFDSLEASQRPPIEEIRILDWSDLRGWLENLMPVADAWLGVGLNLIIEHQDYCAGLSGFRQYLLSSELPYVPPDDDSPLHPSELLKQLEQSVNQKGVMLVGAGGIGKTRTSFEVANLAHAGGWRVLHVLPGEPGVTAEDLAEIVLPNSGRTLLIFDYIDQMQRLDLGSIRRLLLPEVAKRGGQLTLLANSRPLWMKSSNPERDELLTIFPLRPSEEQTAKVTDIVIHTVAPRACKSLGDDEVKRICGGRAIIALLVARELERRAAAGTLDNLETQTLRTGDLVQWLKRRLTEDKMIPSVNAESLSLAPIKPDLPMVAAAATLACAPGREEFLIAVAESSISTLRGDTSIAQYLIALLLELGWLEKNSRFISTAHDVVADEVFDHVLRLDSFIRLAELQAVLSSALTLPRSLGRFATIFSRVIGAVKDEDTQLELQKAAVEWLRHNSTEIGTSLSSGSSDLTSYSLAAVLDGPPWSAIAIELWDTLIAPWLNRYGSYREARHLLYKGLKNVREGQAALLIQASLKWLDLNSATSETIILEASYVLQPILERNDLEAVQVARAVGHAEAWLDKFPEDPGARFVLQPLLNRNDLEVAQVTRAVEHAEAWLDKFPEELTAQFVLHSLLNRNDLEAAQVTRAVGYTEAWLDKFPEDPGARFVLPPLLDRNDLEAVQVARAVGHAEAWLDKFREEFDAGFVLHSLLKRSDLEAVQVARAVGHAEAWLDKFREEFDTQFVIHSLLDRNDLEAAQVTKAVRYAEAWLDKFREDLDAQFVLHSLLERNDLEAAQVARAIGHAEAWLNKFREELVARFVLQPILERNDLEATDLQPKLKYAVNCACEWLNKHHATLAAAFVLPPLLNAKGLTEQQSNTVVEKALLWLNDYFNTQDAEFVLKKLLRNPALRRETLLDLLRTALKILQSRISDANATYILRWCLRIKVDEPALDRELLLLAIQWLDIHFQHPDADFVWNQVLRRRTITDEDWRRIANYALAWLRTKPIGTQGADFTINSLLSRAYLLERQDQEIIIKLGINWLQSSAGSEGKTRMIANIRQLIDNLKNKPDAEAES